MRGALQQLVKATAAAVDIVRRPNGLVILIYHRVGGRTPVSVDLPRALFAEQMAFLAERYRPVTLDDAVELLKAPSPPDGNPPICVTFDDGTADFVDEALPELERYRVPATLYVATKFVDEGIDFPDNGRPASWGGLKDAVSTGLVTVGSHTHSHRLLDRVDGSTAADELDRSIELIEERLGIACEHFAYPKALIGSPDAESHVRSRFRSAALSGTRPNQYGSADVARLCRSPVQVGDAMLWFRVKAKGGMALEDGLRSRRNRRRHSKSVT